jgi:hypothetical protein
MLCARFIACRRHWLTKQFEGFQMALSRLRMLMRIRAASAVGGLVRLPLRGLNMKDLGSGPISEVSRILCADKTGQAAVDHIRAQAKNDKSTYQANMTAALQSYMDPIVESHIREFSADGRDWANDPTARGRYYVSALPASIPGHGLLVCMAEPVLNVDPVSLVRAHDTDMVDVSAGVMGVGYHNSAAGYLNEYADRNADGTSPNYLMQNFDMIREYQKQLIDSGVDPLGPQRLGQSVVFIEDVIRNAVRGFEFASRLKVTSYDHIYDGIAKWIPAVHPKLRNTIIRSTIHYGLHPRVFSELLNGASSGPILKHMLMRGTMLADMRPEMIKTFGAERAKYLLLDKDIRDWYEQSMPFDYSWNHAFLTAADVISADFLKAARILSGPNTVATLTEDQLLAANNRVAMDAAIDRGVEVSRAEGYSGGTAIEPKDPSAIVPRPSQIVIAGPTVPDGASLPLLKPFQPAADAIAASGKDLPKNAIVAQTVDVIKDKVKDAVLADPDALKKTRAELVAEITPKVVEPARQAVDDAVLSAAATSQPFNDAAAQFGPDAAMALMRITLSQTLYTQMSAPRDSVLSCTVDGGVAVTLTHEIREHSGDLQKAYAEAADIAGKRQKDLDKAKQQLDQLKKDKPADKKAQDDLQKQIDDLRKQLERAQADEADAAKAQKENDERADEEEDAASDAEERAKEAEKEITGDRYGAALV